MVTGIASWQRDGQACNEQVHMKYRTHWEIKSTLKELAYTGFAVWCVEHGWTMSDILRIVALAAWHNDKRLGSLVKDYDPDEAKP